MIELNKIYNEDCLEGMKRIPDGNVDCIICDLPYGTTSCKWDNILPFDILWRQYLRIIKSKGAIILFGTEPFTSELILSNRDMYREKLTWVKHKPSNIGNAKYMHLKYSEDIIVFSNGKCTYNPQMQPRISDRIRQAQRGNSKQWRTNRKDTQEVSFATQYAPRDWHTFDADFKYPSNVINIPAVVSNSKEKVPHPTQKPIALIEYLIKTYTNEGDVVLDNCMGSGTTAIACMNTNRNYIGFELDKEYYDLSIKRINEYEPKLAL